MQIPNHKFPIQYNPKYSKILPQVNMKEYPVRVGIWLGNYGAHGNEWVNISIEDYILECTKITGDVNVPRGQVSFVADLSVLPKSGIGHTLLDVKDSSELKNAVIYGARATIAKQGFEEQTEVDCDGKLLIDIVIILSREHFLVYWYGLSDEEGSLEWMSRFQYYNDLNN